MARAIFPAPDHDHDRCASSAIAHAETQCAARAQRLTPIRRRVLEALLASHKPLGAYEIIDHLAGDTRPAPITIYRALDFLLEHGFIHKLESINAFVSCHHPAEAHQVPFLICDVCSSAQEVCDERVADLIEAQAKAFGFRPQAQTLEVHGVCKDCRKA